MGQLHRHTCGCCGYVVTNGGGRQIGFRSVTWTIHCSDCRELLDVMVSETPLEHSESWTPDVYACHRDPAHRVSLWRAGGVCPKCGAAMLAASTPAVMWD
jgi:ribosomal protein S27AE